MTTKRIGDSLHVNLTAWDTYTWAHRRGASWPGSYLSGRKLHAQIQASGDCAGGILDFHVNGRNADRDCPADELRAIVDDYTKKFLE